MGKLRVRELTYKTGNGLKYTGVYVIDEIVTHSGLYITWENRFNSYKNALNYLKGKTK